MDNYEAMNRTGELERLPLSTSGPLTYWYIPLVQPSVMDGAGEVKGGIWYLYFSGAKKDSYLSELLHEKVNYYKLNFPFLPLKQATAKAYEELGIPHHFGDVDKDRLHKMYRETRKCDLPIIGGSKKLGVQNFHKKICFSVKRQPTLQTLVKASKNANPKTVSAPKVLGIQSTPTPLRLRKSVTFNKDVQVIDISPNQPKKNLASDSQKSIYQGRYKPKNLTAELEGKNNAFEKSSRNAIPKPTETSGTPKEDVSLKNTLAKKNKDEKAVELLPATDYHTENKIIQNTQQPNSYNHEVNTSIENSPICVDENVNSIEINRPSYDDKEPSSRLKSNIPESLVDPYTFEQNDQVAFLNNFSLEKKRVKLNKSTVPRESSKIENEKEIDTSSKLKPPQTSSTSIKTKTLKKFKPCKGKKKITKIKLFKKKIPTDNSETKDTPQLADTSKNLINKNDKEAKDVCSSNEKSNTIEFNVLQRDNIEETNFQIADKSNKSTIKETEPEYTSPIKEINQRDASPTEETSHDNSSLNWETRNINAICLPQSPENISSNDNESDISDKFHTNLDNNGLLNVRRYGTIFTDSSKNAIENENSDVIAHQSTVNEDSLWLTLNKETGQQNLSRLDHLRIQEKQSSTPISQELSPTNSQEKENAIVSTDTPEHSPQSGSEIISYVNSVNDLKNYEMTSSKSPQILSPDSPLQSTFYKSSIISSNNNPNFEDPEMEYTNQARFRESKIAQFRDSDDSSLDSHCSYQTSFDEGTGVYDSNGSQDNLNSESITSLFRATKNLNINDEENIINNKSLIVSKEKQVKDTFEKTYNQMESSHLIDEDSDLQRTKSSIVSLSVLRDSSSSFVNNVDYFKKIENIESGIPSHMDGTVHQEGQAIEGNELNEQDIEDNYTTSQLDESINDSQNNRVASNEEVSTAYETEKETGRLKINRTLPKSEVYLNNCKETKPMDKEISIDGSYHEEENGINSPAEQLNTDSELGNEIAVADWLYKSTVANMIGMKNKYFSMDRTENYVSEEESFESKSFKGEEIIGNSRNDEQEINYREIKDFQDPENYHPKMIEFNKKVEKSTPESEHEHFREKLNFSQIRQNFQDGDFLRKPFCSNINLENIIDSRTNNDKFLIMDSNCHVNKRKIANEEKCFNSLNTKALHSKSDVILSHSFSEGMTDNKRLGKSILNLTLPLTSKGIQNQEIIHSSEDYSSKFSEMKEQNEQKSSVSIIGNSDSFDSKELKIRGEKFKINKIDLKTGEIKQRETLNEKTKGTEDNLLSKPMSTHSAIVTSNIIINNRSTGTGSQEGVLKIPDKLNDNSTKLEIENGSFQADEVISIKKEPENSDSDTLTKTIHGKRSPSVIFSSQEILHGKRKNHELRRTRAKLLKSQTEVIMISSSEEEKVKPVRRRTSTRSRLRLGNISLQPSISKAHESTKTKEDNNYDSILRKFSGNSGESTQYKDSIPSHLENAIISESHNFSSNTEHINPQKMKEHNYQNNDLLNKLQSIRTKSRNLANDILSSQERKISSENKVQILNVNEKSPKVKNISPIEEEMQKETKSPSSYKSISMREALKYDKWYRSTLNIGSNSNDSRVNDQKPLNQENIIENPEVISESEHPSNLDKLTQKKLSSISFNSPILSGRPRNEYRSKVNVANADARETNKKIVHSINTSEKVAEKPEMISESENYSNISEQLKKIMGSVSFNKPIIHVRSRLQDDTTSKYFQDDHDLTHESPVQPNQSINEPLRFQREPFQDITNNLKVENSALERPILINSPILSGRPRNEYISKMTAASADERETNKKVVHSININKKLAEKSEMISESENDSIISEQSKKRMSSISFDRTIIHVRSRLQDDTTSKYFQDDFDLTHESPVQPNQLINEPLRFQREPFQDITNNLKINNSVLEKQMSTLDLNFKVTRPSTLSHAMEMDSPDFCSDSGSSNKITNKRRKVQKILGKKFKSQFKETLEKSPLPNKSEILATGTELINTKEYVQDIPTMPYSKSSTVSLKDMSSHHPKADHFLLRRTFFMEKPSE